MAKKARTRKKKLNLNELLNEVSETPVRASCWAERIEDPEAIEFLELCRKKKRGGKFVNSSEVKRVLEAHFGIVIGLNRVSVHLKDECACTRRKPKR